MGCNRFTAQDVIVTPPSLPPARLQPMEQTMSEQFTIEQLREHFKPFILTAPCGLLSTKTFVDLYSDLITVNVGQRSLPSAWSNFDTAQIEALAHILSNGSKFINWRLWLLFASQPSPHPTHQELLDRLFIVSWDEMKTARSSKISFVEDFKQILHAKQADKLSAIDSHRRRTPEQTMIN